MRIISGRFKGKKLSRPTDLNTRPLRDMVKESIFNLIQHSNKINFKIDNADVLDLFSGSGSFGLECVSRGCKNVVFIENYSKILDILKKNINSLKLEKNFKIIENDCFKILNKSIFLNTKFDLIFIDPPYKEIKLDILINRIVECKVLKNNGLIIIHRHKKDDQKLTEKLKILDQRIYGISKIILGTYI